MDREADRTKNSAFYAFAQLQFELDFRSLVKLLAKDTRQIYQLSGEISSLRIQTDCLERGRRNQIGDF